MTDELTFEKACDVDDIWEGEMELFDVGDQEVLIVHSPGGIIRAYDPVCPHQDHPLAEGDLSDCVLTCSAHLWQFDVRTGDSINPSGETLKAYPVKIEDGVVMVAMPASS